MNRLLKRGRSAGRQGPATGPLYTHEAASISLRPGVAAGGQDRAPEGQDVCNRRREPNAVEAR